MTSAGPPKKSKNGRAALRAVVVTAMSLLVLAVIIIIIIRPPGDAIRLESSSSTIPTSPPTNLSTTQGGPLPILREISPEGRLIVTSATCGYLDMLLNWIAQLQSINLTNFLVIAEDLQAYEFLLTVIPRQTVMSSAFGRPFGQKSQKSFEFGSSDYSWCSRPYYLKKLIEQNMTVVWIDSDAMLLKDPFAVVEAGRYDEDILITDDEPILRPLSSMVHYYCSCFVMLRPTAASSGLMDAWAQECGNRSKNQPSMNVAIDKLAGAVKWHVLPRRLYPCGYDADRLTFTGAPGWESPGWVHGNWRVGDVSKELFLKKFGVWRNLRAPVRCGGA